MDYKFISILLSLLSSSTMAIYLPNSGCTYLPNTINKKLELVKANIVNDIYSTVFHYDGSNYINIYPSDYYHDNKEFTYQLPKSGSIKFSISKKNLVKKDWV